MACCALLTQLRYFGFHFNPVNFYYCYDEADTLRWVLAEVVIDHVHRVKRRNVKGFLQRVRLLAVHRVVMTLIQPSGQQGVRRHAGPEPRAVNPRQPARAAAASADDETGSVMSVHSC
jgi:hypothetical protein